MSGLDEKGLLPCPFCGGAVKLFAARVTEEVSISCDCGVTLEPPGPTASEARTIAAWNRRASATPADVGEEPVAFLDADGNLSATLSSPIADMIRALPDPPVGRKLLPLYSATALERVVRDRDEWIRQAGKHFEKECELADRALTTKAKLAKARKHLANALMIACRNEQGAALDAARRFLEETK